MAQEPQTNYKTDRDVSNVRDQCQTPPYAVDILLPYLKQFNIIWEPAAGKLFMVKKLAETHSVVYGDLIEGQNYFHDNMVPMHYDCQVTNPPYGIMRQWLERAIELGKPFALLVKLTGIIGCAEGQRLFLNNDLQLLIPDKRIDFLMPIKQSWTESSSPFLSVWVTRGLNLPEKHTYCTMVKPKKVKL